MHPFDKAARNAPSSAQQDRRRSREGVAEARSRLKQRTLNSLRFDGERGAHLKSKVALRLFESKASLGVKCDNAVDPKSGSHLTPDALGWRKRNNEGDRHEM